jgi:hypothetical protein
MKDVDQLKKEGGEGRREEGKMKQRREGGKGGRR